MTAWTGYDMARTICWFGIVAVLLVCMSFGRKR